MAKEKPTWNTWGSALSEEEKKLRASSPPVAPGDGEAIGGLHILEALSATGLRSMRYGKEITDGIGVERILVNDIEEHAVAMIAENVAHNGLDASRVIPTLSDATVTMYAHRKSNKKTSKIAGMGRRLEDMGASELAKAPFDVIDLDPYGAPTPFIDAVVQSVEDGGMLAVTATDLAVLCGNNPEKCFAKYGCMLKRKYCHEMAVRMVLASLERNANRYGRYIVPLVSLQIDFYLRVRESVHERGGVQEEPRKAGARRPGAGATRFIWIPLARLATRASARWGRATLRTAASTQNQTADGPSAAQYGARLRTMRRLWMQRSQSCPRSRNLARRLTRAAAVEGPC